ncbi:MAG: hypothetical protein JWR90_1049 [Marmoricola sp.]|nr:hypothetical protein [Marmoricola sp.]MCW2847075.1 hypothetical protein [Marmoricola sp.]
MRPSGQEADRGPSTGPVELTLFVSGAAPRSTTAVAVVRAVCDGDLAGGVRLQVQDALADPRAARAQDVVVLPTLVATRPGPRRHLVMDRTDADQVRAWISALSPAAPRDAPAPEVHR